MILDAPLPENFRIYPLTSPEDEPDAPFFIVVITPTLREMRALVGGMFRDASETLLACCQSVHSDDPRYRNLLGMLFFAQECLGAGIAAHELAHASFRSMEWCNVKVQHWRRSQAKDGQQWTNSREELYAEVLETLTKQFWIAAYDRQLAVRDAVYDS